MRFSFKMFGYTFSFSLPSQNKRNTLKNWDGKFEEANVIREYKNYTDLGYF
jgi:hypothetical protein